jgi:hypothetical protein
MEGFMSSREDNLKPQWIAPLLATAFLTVLGALSALQESAPGYGVEPGWLISALYGALFGLVFSVGITAADYLEHRFAAKAVSKLVRQLGVFLIVGATTFALLVILFTMLDPLARVEHVFASNKVSAVDGVFLLIAGFFLWVGLMIGAAAMSKRKGALFGKPLSLRERGMSRIAAFYTAGAGLAIFGLVLGALSTGTLQFVLFLIGIAGLGLYGWSQLAAWRGGDEFERQLASETLLILFGLMVLTLLIWSLGATLFGWADIAPRYGLAGLIIADFLVTALWARVRMGKSAWQLDAEAAE